MDRALYISGIGAREQMRRQATQANNLANVSTLGFKAEIAAQRTAPVVEGPGLRTRAYGVESTTGADLTDGPMVATGRDLDLAIQGPGWFSIQQGNEEVYTRSGSFVISPDGMLVDASGRMVIGEGGPIEVPIGINGIVIGSDGVVSTVPDDDRAAPQELGRLKLVNPTKDEIERGNDGFFRLKAGGQAQADNTVHVASGMLENSNVNAVESLVNMISSARQYEMQLKMVSNIDQNQKSAAQILSIS